MRTCFARPGEKERSPVRLLQLPREIPLVELNSLPLTFRILSGSQELASHHAKTLSDETAPKQTNRRLTMFAKILASNQAMRSWTTWSMAFLGKGGQNHNLVNFSHGREGHNHSCRLSSGGEARWPLLPKRMQRATLPGVLSMHLENLPLGEDVMCSSH